MKIFKSCIAILLTLLMIGSVVSVAIFTTSAAEVNTITVNATSQGASLTSKEINTDGLEKIIVTFSLQADVKLINGQGELTYDSSVLTFEEFSLPTCQNSAVVNPTLTNKVKFNFSSLNLYDYTTTTVFCVATFAPKSTSSATTTVALQFEELNGDNTPDTEDKTIYVTDGEKVGNYTTTCEITAKTNHTHQYTSVVTKKATCTQTGVKTFTCTCGDSYTEVIKATGHKHTSKVTKKATCTQEGVTTYTCACGNTYTKKIAKVAHKTTKSTKKATYFANGYKNRTTCKVCKKVISKGTTLKKLKLKTPKAKYTGGKKKLTVKYTKVSGATGFQVKYKIGKKSVTKTYSTKKSVSKTIKKLKKGTYKVYVRAFVKSGSKKAYSSWTKAKKVKVKG